MSVTKIRKISSWTFLIVTIISLAIFGLFFFGGVGEPYGADQYKNPIYTGELLIWSYALLVVCAVSMILFGITQFFNKFKTNPKGALASLAVLVVFAILLVVAYSIGDGTPLVGINSDSQKYNVAGWLKITDMWLYAMYIFLILCILAILWGSVKTIMKK